MQLVATHWHVTTGPMRNAAQSANDGPSRSERHPTTTVAVTMLYKPRVLARIQLTVHIFGRKNQGLFTGVTLFNAILGSMEVSSGASERAGWVRPVTDGHYVVSTA